MLVLAMLSAVSLLNSYDPTNPSSIDSSLTGSGLSDSYYTQGANGSSAAPGTESPTTVPLVSPTPATTAATGSTGPNVYQQALSSLQQWSDQTLIESALRRKLHRLRRQFGRRLVIRKHFARRCRRGASVGASRATASRTRGGNSALSAGTNVDTTA